jgi:hypothetical protein
MTTTSVPGLSFCLAERLRAWAVGFEPVSSAIELLIAHRSWLARSDFVAACVDLFEGYDYLDGQAPMGCIRWDEVPPFLDQEIACGADMTCFLAIATELAGVDTGIPLGELIDGLDDVQIALVVDAIRHVAAGQQRRRPLTSTNHPATSDVGTQLPIGRMRAGRQKHHLTVF